MNVSEIFHSIQGEGLLAGVPSAFIRTSGCNLRCVWCDTPYTSWAPEGRAMSVAEILERLSTFRTRYAVVTGGEPMIAPEISELSQALRQAGYHITVETAATVWKDIECDLASISPKLRNSTPWDREGGPFAAAHEASRINLEVIRRFMGFAEYQLKFVVDRREDIQEIEALLAQIGPYDPSRVLLMPQGVTREELVERGRWIVEVCKARGFRFCPRLQIDLFGHTRGT